MKLPTLVRAVATIASLHRHCANAADDWSLVLLKDSVQFGARCLDGSPAAYYVKPGQGDNATKFILFWEGGGWCESDQDCAGRASTVLGSSASYRPTQDYTARDLLNTNCTKNPHFCTWTTVYAPYCDGASRAGNLAAPVPVTGHKNITEIFYRGYKNLEATVHTLLSSDPAPGTGVTIPSLSTATHLLVSGSSAGGLTTYLHADYIAGKVAIVNPSAIVKVAPEVGFFIDGASIWGGQHLNSEVFRRIADDMANITDGEADQVNAGCVQATPAANRSQCFFAQWTYPHISTPVFIMNSQVDQWQTSNILACNTNISVSVTPYEPFQPCISDPAKGCNATQFSQWSGYADQFYTALNASLAATPPGHAANNGGFITSCAIHTTAIGGFSYRIMIDGMTMYDALSAWFFQSQGSGDASKYWHFDAPWPGNPTCPGPLDKAACFDC